MKDFFLYYPGTDICNAKFEFPQMDFWYENPTSVVVSEIYTPGLFFIQLASQVDELSDLTNDLQ